MRVPSLTIYEQLYRAIQKDIEELNNQNLRLATGKKINKPSDDPAGTVIAMDYKLNIDMNRQYQRNIQNIEQFLEVTDKVLESGQESLLQLREQVVSGVNKMTAADREYYSSQAASYRDFLLGLSNTKINNRYIFSGYRTDQETFTFNATTYHYDYNGDTGEIIGQVDRGATAVMNILGSRAFGVSLSANMPVTLSDGTSITYSQTTDPATGVNTITVQIGNAGDPDYDTFTVSNIMDVANYLSYAWKYQDIDGSGLDASAALAEKKGLHRIQALLDFINGSSNRMLALQGEIGTRLKFLNEQKERFDSFNLNLENGRARIEDADINETIVEIKKAQVALDVLRSSSAEVLSKTLFDFLK